METFDEQLERVRRMAAGDPKWDLSPNDCAALQAVLDEGSRLRAALEFYANPENRNGDGAYGRELFGGLIWEHDGGKTACEALGWVVVVDDPEDEDTDA